MKIKNISVIIVFILLALLFGYELFVQPGVGIQLVLGFSLIYWRKEIFKENPIYGWNFGLLLILIALLSTKIGWLVLAIFLVYILSRKPEINRSLQKFFGQGKKWKDNEYIAVDFEEQPLKVKNQQLVGEFNLESAPTYQWEDLNFTKIAGNTVVDLGNTILPIGDNIIFINQAFGNIKLIVPPGTSLSMNVSYLVGEVQLNQTEIELRGENMQWQTENFTESPRRVKVVINGIAGDLEVVFV